MKHGLLLMLILLVIIIGLSSAAIAAPREPKFCWPTPTDEPQATPILYGSPSFVTDTPVPDKYK